MHWLSRLKKQPSTTPATGVSGPFQPLECGRILRGLRLSGAGSPLCDCATLWSPAPPIAGEEVERAMKALSSGLMSPELVSATRSVVNRLEGEYDAIRGDDEDDCSDPRLNEAFVSAQPPPPCSMPCREIMKEWPMKHGSSLTTSTRFEALWAYPRTGQQRA